MLVDVRCKELEFEFKFVSLYKLRDSWEGFRVDKRLTIIAQVGVPPYISVPLDPVKFVASSMSCKEGDQASDPSVSKSKLPQNTENASNENVDYDDDDDDISGEGTDDDASSPVSDEGPLNQSNALEEESSLDNDRNGSSLDQVKSLEDVSHDTVVNGDKGFNTTETCNNVLGQEIQPVKETMDVNGFEVEFVRRIFERHPDIAAEFRAKNQHLRNACLSFLLSLIETLCQSLEELSNEDLVEADVALTYLKDAGFKVDWLEEKLDQLKENKEKERSGLARLQEIEENLLKLKLKCSELDALAEQEKSELSVTRTALSFDDLV